MKRDIIKCELNPNKLCDNCGKCDICDLDSNKICNSCGKCIGLDSLDYSKIIIDGVLDNEEDLEEYIFEEIRLSNDDTSSYEYESEYEYIEDIPELREEYEGKIEEILTGKESKELHNEDKCGCGCHEHYHK